MNDSIICTHKSNIVKTAYEIRVLKAEKKQLEYQVEAEKKTNEETLKALRVYRRKLFWVRFKMPLVAVGSGLAGYGLGKLLR